MMPSANSSNSLAFALLLAFLFLIDISIAGCYVLLVIIVLLFIFESWKGMSFPRLPFFCVFFAAYMFFTLLATVFSIDRAASVRDNKELLIFLLIPIYLWLLNSRKRVWLSLWTVLAAGVFSSLVGIATVIGRGIVLSDRLKGFTSHWMTYAGLLLFPFVFFFVLLLLGRSKKQTVVLSSALAVMAIAIAFSLTRNVWLGIGAALMLFLVFFKPKILLALAPLLLIALWLSPQAIKNRAVSIVDLQDSSNRERICMVYSGMKIFSDHPWTGVGANNIEKVISGNEARYRHPRSVQVNPHLHNNFLQILAERGIFALASFLLACVFIILQLLQSMKTANGERRAIAVGVLFVFIAFMVAGLFEYNFGDSEIKFILFYFLCLPFLGSKEDDHVQTETD